MASEVATLAGGCFWCTEAVFNDVIGVEKVESGYIGGTADHPPHADAITAGWGHPNCRCMAERSEDLGQWHLLRYTFFFALS